MQQRWHFAHPTVAAVSSFYLESMTVKRNANLWSHSQQSPPSAQFVMLLKRFQGVGINLKIIQTSKHLNSQDLLSLRQLCSFWINTLWCGTFWFSSVQTFELNFMKPYMKGEYINHSSGTINSKYGTPAELFYPKHQRDFLSTVVPVGT